MYVGLIYRSTTLASTNVSDFEGNLRGYAVATPRGATKRKCRYFSNWRLKHFQVATTPVPSDFDGLLYPHVRGYPRIFFHQNDSKGYKRDYLDASGHFVLRFGAIGEKPLGG